MADWFDQNAPDWFAKNAPSAVMGPAIRPATGLEQVKQRFRDVAAASHDPFSLWRELNPSTPAGTVDIDESVPYWLLGGATLGKSRLASTVGQAAKGVLRGQKLSKALQEAWQAVRSEANYIPRGQPAPGYSPKVPEGAAPPTAAPNFGATTRDFRNPSGAPVGEPVPAMEYPPHPSGKPYPQAVTSQSSSAPGVPNLDEIAQGYGFKSFNVIKSQKDRSNVYSAWRAASQSPSTALSTIPDPIPAVRSTAPSVGSAPAIEGIPAPKPVHEAAHAIDTHFSPRKAMNLTRHLQEQGVPFEEVNAMVAKAKATGNWDAINALEKDAWTSGKALEASGAAKPGTLVPKTPYRPKTADYSGIEGIENTEGTWDRVLKNYPKPRPAITPQLTAPQPMGFLPPPSWPPQPPVPNLP